MALRSGFAAALSGLLPGLGQLYQERWLRGALMLLIPALALTLVATFILAADALAAIAIRNAPLVALLVVGALFAYHVVVVADAFAGRLGEGGLRGRLAMDYAILGIVTLVLAGGYFAVYQQSNAWAGLLARVFEPVTFVLPISRPEPAAPQWSGNDRLNVLILGIDSRADASTDNTDTVIVLSVDPLNRTAMMLSIPRDTYVPIPGHGSDKINAAYGYGGATRGPEIARRTVEDLLGVPIHSYALIDFAAFTKIVDSVGGVLVDVRRPLRDEQFPTADFGVQRVQFLAGPQLMSGELALRYARSRHDSNDFSRARRQQDVLAALRTRLVQGGLGRLPATVERVGPGVRTNFEPGNMLPLARTGFAIEREAIRSEVLVPCGNGEEHCELTEQNAPDGYYLFPDRPKLLDLVAQLFYDPRVRREGARIEVRATGVLSGVATAREVAERLGSRAFTIVRATDGRADRSAVVLRDQSKRHTAEELRRQLGIPLVIEPAEAADADIVVRLGGDFRGLATDLATNR